MNRQTDETLDNKPDYSLCKIFSLSHLAIISVTGGDSSKFLQGQLTCDINNLTENRASIAAFCNPKGRVISPLIIVKTAESFFLILPLSLVDKVLNKLRLYILRSAVRLENQTGNLQLLGLQCLSSAPMPLDLPVDNFAVKNGSPLVIKLPSSFLLRYLCITSQSEATPPQFQQNDFSSGELDEWRYQDISSGLPWFESDQSEAYIPQMLNIDELGGISFNKGCYTGQEIIARTHFLGKAKRSLFLAESNIPLETSSVGLSILDQETQQSVGNVLSAQTYSQHTRMLIVLQIEGVESKHLMLDDTKRTALKIVAIQ